MTTWYTSWFDSPLYAALYRHRDDAEAHASVDLFERTTCLPRHSRVLDLACGSGRHVKECLSRGYDVVGADLAAARLAEARSLNSSDARLVRCDMKRLPFARCFDAVLHLFTAFGYFDDTEQDGQVLDEVSSCLRHGGWYMLDYLNAEAVRRNLVPVTRSKVNGCIVTQERSIVDDRVVKRITAECDGHSEEYCEKVRLYDPESLQSMLVNRGFGIHAVYGNYDGLLFGQDSPRCILISKWEA
jgi:SAM-dependent methyltransferase